MFFHGGWAKIYIHGMIGMVEIMVDEVEGRSYKGVTRVHVVQESRDEVSTKPRFEKLHESYYLYLKLN